MKSDDIGDDRGKTSQEYLGPFLQALETDGYFKTVEDEAGTKQLRPLTMYLGSGQALAQIQPQQAEQMYGRFSPDSGQSARQAIPFLNHFGRLLVTALFLDRRLTSLTAVGVIDFLTQSPQHDLRALYLDDDARERLHEEMLSSFGRAVWPDMSQGNRMSLKVSDADVLPTAEDRLSHKKMAEFRSIESEGDGMKSYVATCVALLLGRRPVCLVDEPEMCLHPPQAYNLGRFIGRYGAGRDTMTVVATHSSHLLRGVLQTAEQVQIVRLNRRDRKFSAHLVPAVNLTEALERPTLKAEAVLDGIFAQAVAVVEADGDRLVYQAVWETVQPGHRSVWPTSIGAIFEFGFLDAILQMWAAFLGERAGVLGDRFGTATVEEALSTSKTPSRRSPVLRRWKSCSPRRRLLFALTRRKPG